MRLTRLLPILALALFMAGKTVAQSSYPEYGNQPVPSNNPPPDRAYQQQQNSSWQPSQSAPNGTFHSRPVGVAQQASNSQPYWQTSRQPATPYGGSPVVWDQPPGADSILGGRPAVSVAQLPQGDSPPTSGAEDLDVAEAMAAEIAESVDSQGYFYQPAVHWFTVAKWEGSIEVGLNGSAGNSESLSIQSGFDLKLVEGDYVWQSDLNYVKTRTNSTETQHNALFNYGVKREFGESPWSLFAKSALEYDEFKAWDVRWSINTGLGYRLWKSDITELTGRFGAGASREFGGPDKSWAQEAVFGLDFERQFSKRQKFKFSSEYFPEWQNFADYRLVTALAWEFLLDEENNLSLKLDVTDRYDSTPSGRKPNDINYSLLLLWKT